MDNSDLASADTPSIDKAEKQTSNKDKLCRIRLKLSSCDANDQSSLSRSEQKLLAIVSAAEEVFIDLGYQNTSMDKIAEAAQVSKRTVYNHFATKAELFNFILYLLIDQLFTAHTTRYDANRALDEQIKEILLTEWQQTSMPRIIKLKRVVLAEYITTPEFINPIIEDIQRYENDIKNWLQAALDDKRLKPMNVEFALEFLVGAIKAFAHDPLLFDQPLPSDADRELIIEEITQMFLLRYRA